MAKAPQALKEAEINAVFCKFIVNVSSVPSNSTTIIISADAIKLDNLPTNYYIAIPADIEYAKRTSSVLRQNSQDTVDNIKTRSYKDIIEKGENIYIYNLAVASGLHEYAIKLITKVTSDNKEFTKDDEDAIAYLYNYFYANLSADQKAALHRLTNNYAYNPYLHNLTEESAFHTCAMELLYNVKQGKDVRIDDRIKDIRDYLYNVQYEKLTAVQQVYLQKITEKNKYQQFLANRNLIAELAEKLEAYAKTLEKPAWGGIYQAVPEKAEYLRRLINHMQEIPCYNDDGLTTFIDSIASLLDCYYKDDAKVLDKKRNIILPMILPGGTADGTKKIIHECILRVGGYQRKQEQAEEFAEVKRSRGTAPGYV